MGAFKSMDLVIGELRRTEAEAIRELERRKKDVSKAQSALSLVKRERKAWERLLKASQEATKGIANDP